MSQRTVIRYCLLLFPFLFASLACNYVLSPFLPPTPTPTVPALAELPQKSEALRPPTATPTPTFTPTPTPTLTPTITPLPPTPTIDSAALNHPDRPDLSGETAVFGTEHFLIHYTLSGRDAVSSADDNASGVPEFVEAVAEAMEYSWQVEVIQLGWAAPPTDGGIGGDARYDVYLEDIYDEGTAGVTYGGERSAIVGDNPNTPALVETRSSYSFLVLDNDYREDNIFPPLDIMRVTAAHEFNHAIQFGLDADEPADWLWEATATWMEDLVYDHINDQDYYLDAVFRSSGTCQIAEGDEGGDDEFHWYGMWIFLRYVSENYGNDVIRLMWENLVTQDGYSGLETVLAGVNTNLDEVFRGFAVALLTRGFEEGAGYPTIQLAGKIEAGRSFTSDAGIAQMAMEYVQIMGQEIVAITLQRLDQGMVVGVRGNETDLFAVQNGQISVDAAQYDYLYVIVFNLSRANREAECQETGYSIQTGQGGAASTPDRSISAAFFHPPDVRLLPDND